MDAEERLGNLTAGGAGAERRLLRRLANARAAPRFLRRAAEQLEGSKLGYRLAHGAFWSLAGNVLARGLTLASSVVAARVLGKAGYGELGVVASTLFTFQAFAGMGLALTSTKYVAELRSTDPARAGRILALSTVVGAVTGVLATAALWTWAPWLATHTISAPGLARPLRIAATGLLFTTLGGAQVGALSGFEAFRLSTRVNMWAGLVGVPVAVAGVVLWGLEGAVWAMAANGAIQWALTHVAVRAEARRHGVRIDFRGFWRERRILWTFSLPALAQGIMVTPVTWAASAILVGEPGGYAEMGAFNASNQWYSLIQFLATGLSGAILPVLSERVGLGDRAGARKVLLAAVAMNAALVVPIIAVAGGASRWIMGLYGPAFAEAWPTLVVTLVTAGIVAATNPVGNVLAASDRLWLGFLMNSGWAAVLLGATVGLVRWGALGIASARLIAYLVHAVWTAAFAVWFVRASRPGSAP